MKKLSLILLICFCLSAGAAEAQTVRQIKFDQQTLSRGFSVKSFDDNFWLPIFPGQFNYPLEIKMWLQGYLSVPDEKRLVSNIYWYEVEDYRDGFLEKPVLLSLKYNSDSARPKGLYFFDKSRQTWRRLDTQFDWINKQAKAWSPVPAASIAVLEDLYDFSGNLTAKAAIVADTKTGEILFKKNSEQVLPIASISKLVTALVFLDYNPGWNKIITIEESDNAGGAGLPVEAGDKVTVRDTFFSALLASNNNSARALMRSTGLSEADFVKKMNEKVKELGTLNTQFIEPTGLSEYNLSTAQDLFKISRAAFSHYEFLEATTLKYYRVTVQTPEETKQVWIKNTNKLVDRDLYLLGGKTGYTEEAGRCLVTKARQGDRELIALVLNSDISQNYEEVYSLLKFYLK
ncbi:MAG: D-alanyl-D-alanine carboxypeptidase family protein [Patescibacteria group bacterium]